MSNTTGGPRIKLINKPTMSLGIVAIVYFVVQITAVDPGRFFEWDEAVYTAEVSRFADAVFFSAHRGRGITFVVAPIVQVTDSMTAIRIYQSVASSAGLFFAFLPWVRVSRWTAPIGAALFASSWLAIFYGSEVMPNLYSALLAVGAVGVAIRFLQVQRGAYLYGMAVCVALAAFVRPLDAALLVGGITLLSVLLGLRSAWKPAVAAVIGFVVGMVPWVIEAAVRFGGVAGRLQQTSEIVGGGLNNNFVEYLRLMDGPLSWPDRSPLISGVLAGWMICLLGLAITGLAMSSGFDRKMAVSTLSSSAFLATPYLVLSEASAPRFMMPALAFLCICAGIGLSKSSARFEGVPKRVGVSVTLVFLLVANYDTLNSVADEQELARAGGQQLAQALEVVSQSGNCYFLSASGYPQISLVSGCRGGRTSGDLKEDRRLLSDAAEEGLDVFVLINNPEVIEVLNAVGVCAPIDVVSSANWQLCDLTGSQWLEYAADG